MACEYVVPHLSVYNGFGRGYRDEKKTNHGLKHMKGAVVAWFLDLDLLN